MAGTKYATSDRTKIAIIKAAGELFAVSGVDAVSTREIAKRAEENIGSIHYHFGGKPKLAKATIDYAISLFKKEGELGEIVDNDQWYTGPESKARLIREITVHHLKTFFKRDIPNWARRLIYLSFTDNGKLGVESVEEHMQPHCEILVRMMQRIKPEMTPEEASVWVFCYMGQITYPSLMRTAILRLNNEEDFSMRFLHQFCERVIENTTRGLGLPYEQWSLEDYCAAKLTNIEVQDLPVSDFTAETSLANKE